MARICSASLAVVSVGPSWRARITATIESMPKVITGPGSRRAIQSKRSNGRKGNPARLSPRRKRAMTAREVNAPNRIPMRREGLVMESPMWIRLILSRYAEADVPHLDQASDHQAEDVGGRIED